jgi:hypothetical protein
MRGSGSRFGIESLSVAGYMGRMRRLTWLIVSLALALAAAAQAGSAAAAPRALLDAPRAQDVAVAGGEVLVAATTARGGARLTAVPVSGGPARTVLHAKAPGRRGWTSTARLASSSQLAALLVEFTDPEGNTREWRVYAGPPAGPLEIVQRVRLRRPGRIWFPIDLDVHGDRLLVQEVRSPRPILRLTVRAPGVSPAPVPQGAFGAPAAVAGERVAYLGVTGRADALPVIRIVDWRTGRLSATIELGRQLREVEEADIDLTDGARAVVDLDGRLFAGAPGERARRLPGTSGAPPLSAPRFAGERVAARAEGRLETHRPVVIDPGTATHHTVGPPSTALTALAADQATVAWLANGCVLAADVEDVTRLRAAPPGPCPRAEVVLDEHDQKLRGRSLRVRVTCVAAPPRGCRGAVVVRFGGRAGQGRFRVPVGKRRVARVRLSRRGMAVVRRQFRLDGVALLRLGARMANGRMSREAGPGWILVKEPR